MRIKITLKCTQETFIPFNYNTIQAGIIYTTLHDEGYSHYLHENKGFKYWSISNIYFHNYHMDKSKGGFIVREGLTFTVSCPDTYFINTLMQGLTTRQHVYINNQRLLVDSVEVEPYFVKQETMQYKTISPVCVRSKRLIDGKVKTYDLNPSEEKFYKQMGELIVKKYNQYTGRDEYAPGDVLVSSSMRNVKGVRVAISKAGNVVYNRAYYMDLEVKAPVLLQDFLYDCGLGEKTAMGFGCIVVD